MQRELAIHEISNELEVAINGKDYSLMMQVLRNKINELLNTDFQKLVSILYKMDISESKLKMLLKENLNADAAGIIADMMIERQEQKIRSRQEYRRDQNISDEESW